MEIPDILMKLHNAHNECVINIIEFYPTGSAYTCNPPVIDTDEDWLLCCHQDGPISVPFLRKELWLDGYSQPLDKEESYPECESFRKGSINIILCYRMEFFNNWVKATEICRNLNLTHKEQRKLVHHILCDEYLDDTLPKFIMPHHIL